MLLSPHTPSCSSTRSCSLAKRNIALSIGPHLSDTASGSVAGSVVHVSSSPSKEAVVPAHVRPQPRALAAEAGGRRVVCHCRVRMPSLNRGDHSRSLVMRWLRRGMRPPLRRMSRPPLWAAMILRALEEEATAVACDSNRLSLPSAREDGEASRGCSAIGRRMHSA